MQIFAKMAKKSTMSELDETADQIKDCYHRLDQLERKLKFQTMTDAQRWANKTNKNAHSFLEEFLQIMIFSCFAENRLKKTFSN